MPEIHHPVPIATPRAARRGGYCGGASSASIVLLLAAVASPSLAANLVEVRAITHPDFVRVIFETDAPVAYSVRNQSATPLRVVEVQLPVVEAQRLVWKSASPLSSIGVDGVGAVESVVRLAVDQAVYVWLSAGDGPPRIIVDLRPLSASADAGSDFSVALSGDPAGGASGQPEGELTAFPAGPGKRARTDSFRAYRIVVVPQWELGPPARGRVGRPSAADPDWGSRAGGGRERPPPPERVDQEASSAALAAREAATALGDLARWLLSNVPGWFALVVPWLGAAAIWGGLEWRAGRHRRSLGSKARGGAPTQSPPEAAEAVDGAAGSAELLATVDAAPWVESTAATRSDRGAARRGDTAPPRPREATPFPALPARDASFSDFLPMVQQLDRRVADLEREFAETRETLAALRELSRGQDEALRAQRIALTRLLRRIEPAVQRAGPPPPASSS